MAAERGPYASQDIGAEELTQLNRKHLFCINGAADFLEVLRVFFEDEQYNVTTTNYVPRTFEQIEALQPDAIILDLAVTHRTGWTLLEQLAIEASTRDIPVIVVSTDPRILDEAAHDVERYGGQGHIIKPLDLDVLLSKVHELIGTS